MTRKVFWEDPYLTTLNTQVKSVHDKVITLEATIFYAFSGGQESDSGSIAGYSVLEARKDGKEIFYTLPEHTLKPGDEVEVKIDWPRRYRLMKLHFSAEIVLEIVMQRFPDLKKVGAHISADKARIDFENPESFSSLIPEFCSVAQTIIDSDQPIESAFSDEPNERRYWKIKEFSQVPCGGTHLKRTAEIGKLRLKRVNPGKGRERIEIYIEDTPAP